MDAAEQARIRTFQAPQQMRAVWQVVSTFGPYLALSVAMYALAKVSVWLTLLLAIPYSGLMIRIFIFQHDCGHNSFFSAPLHNRILGRACSLVTLTPFAWWRRVHARHHVSQNNLDLRGYPADFYTDCLTLAEYEALSPLKRRLYRISHNPALIHLLQPLLVFLVLQRLPFDTPLSFAAERRSVYGLNLALLLIFGPLIYLFGIKTVLLVHLPALTIASIIGIWLFSVQHRFEESQWFSQADWTQTGAALHGSSYLKLPRLLRWFSADIGTHHLHHLRPSIPNYRLHDCHEACRETMAVVTTLTLAEALKTPSFALWDEKRGRMVPFPAE
ncbi:fatty acid desaturase [Acidisoma cellulosilytica]|uniref:Fatty acid desaturase n=2 Tax=Acidisoma cellulosilyticum TaxID=2802395 RepID=A0A963Z7K2_9PROT|nr:fatty acid desaturase [Acidisoma cellulosilyticum]